MHHLRHHLASGPTLENIWEIDRAQRVIVISFRLGNAPSVHMEIDVCSARLARVGAYALRSLDGEASWVIAPAKYAPGGRFGLRAVMSAIHPRAPAMSFLLTNCPPDDADFLRTL